MKNNIFYKLKSKVLIEIKGKNIERFIKRLVNNKIELLKIKYIKYNQIKILVYKEQMDKILELKSIYDVTEERIYGIIKLKQTIQSYKYILIFLTISIVMLLFLSKIIFSIDVIHNNSEVRKLISTELEEYKISKYHFKKSFQDIQVIKNKILEKYKDKIEWLEIEENGTKYIIRLEIRIIPDNKIETTKQNVIAKKSAIIKKIVAYNGEVIREINEYVNQGDVVISGNVYLYENVKDVLRANGIIYGEVWYTVTVEYPFIYSEIKETGNMKEILTFNFLNKKIEFTKDPFKEKRIDSDILFKHNFLPISFNKEKQKEVITLSEVLTEQQAIQKATMKANDKMKEALETDEYILNSQILKKEVKDDKIELTYFYSVLENITAYQTIEEGSYVP